MNAQPRSNSIALPTVFFIEEDQEARSLMEQLMATAGYRVQSYSSTNDFARQNGNLTHHGCVILGLKVLGVGKEPLLTRQTNLPLIIISESPDVRVAVQAIKSGAFDYLVKPVEGNELLKVVEQAIMRCACEDTRRAAAEAVTARINTLTFRERQVMLLVVEGLPNKLIADKLGTAEKTVKVHRGRVMRKMEVHSIAQLVHDVEHALVL